MKKLTCLLILFSIVFTVYSQKTSQKSYHKKSQKTDQETLDSAYYLQKSRDQKATGFILLGAGLATTMIGLTSTKQDSSDGDIGGALDGLDDSGKYGAILLAGLVMDVASISLFTSAKKNKQKGLSLQVNSRLQNIAPNTMLSARSHPVPSLCLKISF